MIRRLCIAALAALAAHAQAAYTLYIDEAAYLAAVGANRVSIDFAGSPAAVVDGGSFAAEVTFGSCTEPNAPISCVSQVLHNSDAITDIGGSAAPNGVSALAWRFDIADAVAFAFHYVSGAIEALAIVAPDLSIELVDTAAASGFIGLVADAAFFGGIGVNAFIPGIGRDRYFIDDFRIDAAAVPSGGTLALAGAALAVAGLGRPRRSKFVA